MIVVGLFNFFTAASLDSTGRSPGPRTSLLMVSQRGPDFLLRSGGFERELAEVAEAGNTNSNETQRSWTVVEAAVELPAGEVADCCCIVDARVKRRRAAAD